jgi:hypothetical protein
MIHPAYDNLPAVAHLLGVLEEQIELLEHRLRHLDELTAAMIKVDNDSMEGLLSQMDAFTAAQEACHQRLSTARAAAAAEVGLPPGARLSQMADALGGRAGLALGASRQRLAELMALLKRRHMETSLLLVECMRVNRLMLDQILPRGPAVAMYGSDGVQNWRSSTGVVDAEL